MLDGERHVPVELERPVRFEGGCAVLVASPATECSAVRKKDAPNTLYGHTSRSQVCFH